MRTAIAILSVSVVFLPNGLAQGTESATVAVSPDWDLVPSGLDVDDEFRLLFVSSTTRNASNRKIATYDSHVQSAVESGHEALQAYKTHFKALASTQNLNARDHTKTTYTSEALGVPIYWVDGSKVADHYSDFYDGDWDSNTPTDESGTAVSGTSTDVFTGSRADGTTHPRFLGASGNNRVGDPFRNTSELSYRVRPRTHILPFYGLSGVFKVSRTVSVSGPVAGEGSTGATAALEFEVSVSPAPAMGQTVTVKYSDASSGTATSGVDYEALTAGTLTFSATNTSETVTVTVKGDDMDEPDETVVLRLESPSGAALEGGVSMLDVAGTIVDDDHPVGEQVPVSWTLLPNGPNGLAPGAKFRLLFVTSTSRNANAVDIGKYDKHVRQAVSSGRPALQPYTDHFKALGSTADVDARVHTESAPSPFYSGLPIYWVGGAKVADDYSDFFDGDWDSNDSRNESGTKEGTGSIDIFTGSASDGSRHPTEHLGRDAGPVRLGNPLERGKELDSGGNFRKGANKRFYGLSGVFTVVGVGEATVVPTTVSVNGDLITLTFPEELDPAAGRLNSFHVGYREFGKAPFVVTKMEFGGKELFLTLDRAVRAGDVINVLHTGGFHELAPLAGLRTRTGAMVAPFSIDPDNVTPPTLSINAPRVVEGDAGESPHLDFKVTLDVAATSEVKVDYADATTGSATSATDYDALQSGTLTFSKGDKSKTIRVTVIGDDQEEEHETVVLELSNAVNADLQGGGSTLRATGTITNDDAPAAGDVPVTWSLTPSGLIAGAQFRLLFVTSSGRHARAASMRLYDRHVQDAVEDRGRAALRSFSSKFQALASTADTDARDHTVTTFADTDLGVPIYWVGGAKVADEYQDFYDGIWDSNEPRDETGAAVAADTDVFTGSDSEGTAAVDGQHVGQQAADVRAGTPATSGSELSAGTVRSTESRPFYGLSGVFRVVAAPTATLALVSAAVDQAQLTLTYGDDLDPDSLPATGDFAVTVDGDTASVSSVGVEGSEVRLTLASPVPVGGTVTVSYTTGTTRLRTLLGKLAAGFAATSVTNNTKPLLSVSAPSVREGADGTTAALKFEVTLSPAATVQVMVDYAEAGTGDMGTAGSGTDYDALTSDTLTFEAGETSKTVTVTVKGDDVHERDETVVLKLSNAMNADLQGGGSTLLATGTITNDDAPAAGDVPVTWSLTPSGLTAGAQFRLLFVTSSGRHARAANINLYDRHVQDAVDGGRAALRSFSSKFQALVSMADTDARDHTVTTLFGTDLGVPIYWVGGAKVADEYQDFYDGTWNSNEPRDETGAAVAADTDVFTGSDSDGTAAADGQHVGQQDAQVRVGTPGTNGSELSAGTVRSPAFRPVYGISGVFRVVATPTITLAPVSAAVDQAQLTLTYREDLDPDSLPATGDFAVTVDGDTASVSSVGVEGSEVRLTLASPVPVGGTVTVSYTTGTTRLRTLLGQLAAGFAATSVTNNTKPVLSVSSPRVLEGATGSTGSLAFEVTLSPAAGSEVTVEYADVSADEGTATSGTDYEALTGGTLTFSAGDTSATVSVTVNGDDEVEEHETVLLELRSAVNAALQGGGSTLLATGTIINDDVPAAGDVPVTWSLTPSGLTAGAQFRLLFVTSSGRHARAANINLYDRHVRTAVDGGRAALRSFSSKFQALASTADIDARVHTVTTIAGSDLGVPVYWVSGTKVADDYQDFYDGTWDSNEPRDEAGATVAAGTAVFTGSGSDGTAAADGLHVGQQDADVRTGLPGTNGSELSAGVVRSTESRPFYGLSGVFSVVAAPASNLALPSAEVNSAELTLDYGEDLDPDAVPAVADFSVTVAGNAVSVSDISISGQSVTLTLASAVGIGDAVTVSYTAGTTPVRTPLGKLAAGFSDFVVTNNTQPTLSINAPRVVELDSGQTAFLEFEVGLLPTAEVVVMVDYAISDTGTATSGTDYQALAGDTLTFSPGDALRTVRVAVIGDEADESDETVVLELSNAVGAVLRGGGTTLAGTGTIIDDEAPSSGEVPVTWGLAPPGLVPGERFRLLFVTSSGRHARAGSMNLYDRHVQNAVRAGRAALRPFRPGFRVLASTADTDARDHTVTTYSSSDLGVPIYWVGGEKVADEYQDFYDGNWDSNKARDETGAAVAADTEVFTGSGGDGTAAVGLHVGQQEADVGTGAPGTNGSELSGGIVRSAAFHPFYGLSAVFTLANAPAAMLDWVSASVKWSELTLTYASDLDPDYAPAPGEFRVIVDGAAATVVEVSVRGPQLTLVLEEPVPIGGTVTASYTAGTRRLRTVLGVLVADFPVSAIQNDTKALLSVGVQRVGEGSAGEERFLDFVVSLRPALTQVVTVEYADVSADEGTATSGTDYRPLGAGTLRFEPGDTSKSVRVTVLGDNLAEPDETVVLRLSGATNAELETGLSALDVAGTIGNDDVPIQEVISTWGLVPEGVAVGESFRLLFVTSSSTRAGTPRNDQYDRRVRDAASNGMAAIRPYGEHLWAFMSTAEVSAREYTVTGFSETNPGVPVYWLNGAKVAENYRDFYDGSWASNSPTGEHGRDAGEDVAVFTGSAADGSRDPGGQHPGNEAAENIRVGKPHVFGSEIASADTSPAASTAPVYGLSGVFTVVSAGTAVLSHTSVTVEDGNLTLTYDDALDFDSVPDPDDFAVTVEGVSRAVSEVTVTGSSVILRLASEVVLGEAVTVSYAGGTNPLRSQTGRHAAPLSEAPVLNLTKRKLLFAATVAFEGDPFEIIATLSPASDQSITVRYRTDSGTATQGVDFEETTGTLTFQPGETSKAIRVGTFQDDLDEPNETLAVILSNATNLDLPDGQAEFTLVAWILDDDEAVPVRVPPSWELVPSGLADGDSFRLLFVSAEATDATTESIALYDRHVIEAAAGGDGAIRVFGDFFWVLASVAGIDARDYANSTYTSADAGVPIYWLGGARVADDYEDFYDGEWASNLPRDQFGERMPLDVEVFTGSESDGTKDLAGSYLGTSVKGAVTLGMPGVKGGELDAEERTLKGNERRLYGLSGVFIIDRDASVPESSTDATLELSPAAVAEGSDSAKVTVTLNLSRPARTDEEWDLRVRDGTALSPEDFSATPRIQTLSVASGATSADGAFEISTMHEPDGIPECPESVLIRAVRSGESGASVASASARLKIMDPEGDEVFCGPPAEGLTVDLTPTGGPNPAELPLTPPTEEEDDSPPTRLGTPARLAIWTERAGYTGGQQVRLFRSVDPMGDSGTYTFFYYLENTLTRVRHYFAPGIRSTALEPRVVDQFGMGAGAIRAAPFEPVANDLVWVGAAPDPGSWQFVAEVRSADRSQIVKVSHAKFNVAVVEPRQVGSPDGPLVLTADQSWYSDFIYKLRGTVRVASGATLRVEAGTLVEALGPEARIVVERGGRIEIQGTRLRPVVMTCDAALGHRQPGCWGGLTVLGRAPVDSGGGPPAQLPVEAGWEYGGDVPDDSSGTLRFLRVEFAGGSARAGSSSPALGLYGVGSGTRIEYVQAHAGSGDGIAFRGGSANCRYCVSSGSFGDLLDWAEGWHGTAQHLFLHQGNAGGHGIHGQGSGDSSAPPVRPAVFNATLVGGADQRPLGSIGDGIRLSRGAALAGGNWVVVGFRGLGIQAGGAESWRVGNGLGNVILYRNGFGQIASAIRPHVDFRARDPVLLNRRYEPSPDPRPASDSVALDARAAASPPVTGGHWESAPYAGAFGSWLWTEEWTHFGQESDLRFVRLPVLSIEGGSALEGQPVEFVVRLRTTSQEAVTVRYRTASATATEGVDFVQSSGTLTFPPGETVQTIAVSTTDDELPEEAETFRVLLTEPRNADLASRSGELAGRGTIHGSDMPPVEVPPRWRFVPPDLAPGDSFRLLFVSALTRDASAGGIAEYDEHVRAAAATGHAAMRPYSAHFRVLGSTRDVDARAHTVSAFDAAASGDGIPIYWVGGGLVADDYGDFYGGAWSLNPPTDEFGNVLYLGAEVFTGSASDGTGDRAGRVLGTRNFPTVKIGRPWEAGSQLDAGEARPKDFQFHLYGLSSVFSVSRASVAHLQPFSARVDARQLTLTYREPLDPERPPLAGDFTVKVDGVERSVSEVSVQGVAVTLVLDSPAEEGESVTVSYHTQGHRPRRLRAASGALVAVFGDEPVSNVTKLVVSVAPASAFERGPGEVSNLDFEFSLNFPSKGRVRVVYADTGKGTATSAVDYEALAGGTVTFEPGQVSRIVSVKVLGDRIDEPSETVVLRLSGVENAHLDGDGRTLDVPGAILNDDFRRIRVSSTWRLIPEGLAVGDSFRLLFVTSTGSRATEDNLASYDSHVRAVAAGGHGAVRPFSDHFKVLGSTAVRDARDHTETRYDGRVPGVPIYWLGGAKVADDYRDFYDGDWDSNTPANESGRGAGSQVRVFTGTASDGTKDATGRVLGPVELGAVALGSPGSNGSELASGDVQRQRLAASLYGLSGVFEIVPSGEQAARLRTATANGDELTLGYGEALDSDAVPAATDFEVTVGGAPRSVLEVAVKGSSVTLRLAERVVIDQAVTVSYTPGQRPIQTAVGALARSFSGRLVMNETPLALSAGAADVLEGASGSRTTLEFEIVLSVPVDRVVTVDYADAGEGTATPGSDYATLPKGTLVFEPGEVSKTVAVTVAGDDLPERSETVILRLSRATNAELAGSAETLDVVGTIWNDDVSEVEVPATWGLIPEGLAVGDSFRLLFVTSAGSRATEDNLASYDSHVRAVAAGGHGAVRPFSDHFQAFASTGARDARDHTGTRGDGPVAGVPIYWLGGGRVADDYRDFYDGDWDSNAPTNESGLRAGSGVRVFTGTAGDGTADARGRVLGPAEQGAVLLGRPELSGRELDSGDVQRQNLAASLYGLSGVFVIVPPGGQAAALVAATANGDELTLEYGVPLDPGSAPDAADFEVTAGGAPRSVLEVAVAGSSVQLRLARRVALGEAVTVSYKPGGQPLQTGAGAPAESFSGRAAANETPLELQVEAPGVFEGDSGSTAALEFEVTLPVPAERVVTVAYADSGEGTATPGSDYAELSAGTLIFEPGEVSKTVAVAVRGDDLTEGSETVILRLSRATNVQLAGGVEALDVAGSIWDDEVPELEVPVTWRLIPEGLAVGDSFRLLFVSSLGRNASAPDLAEYDSHVRAAVAGGHAAVRSFSDHFQVLGSSVRLDARDHTVTAPREDNPGVPVYWLGGERVADDYRDFYDGDWDSNAPTNESGESAGPEVVVFTGTDSDGTGHGGGRVIGSQEFGAVVVGYPHESGNELNSGEVRRRRFRVKLYGLSRVFVIVPPSAQAPELVAATVNGGELTLEYGEPLDSDAVPDAGDFEVRQGGVARVVAGVTVAGSSVTLRVADRVVIGAEDVTVSYTPGRQPVQTAVGTRAEPFSGYPADNVTPLELSVGPAGVLEGGSGSTAALEFEVTLPVPVDEVVAVDYADSGEGTATPGVDYAIPPDGTLVFEPGEASKTIAVTVRGDELAEGSETVILRLSGATSAQLAGGVETLDAVGSIWDDDVPELEVPVTWRLVPEGLAAGDSFRLLFVSSTRRDAAAPDLAGYDSHVRAAVAAGHAAARGFSEHFQVLASSARRDARDHTATAFDEGAAGIPVYWLGGGRVADDYRDFYDGDWDSNAPTDESGRSAGPAVIVFTGTASDGSGHAGGAVLGPAGSAGVLLGRPGESGKELDSGEFRPEGLEAALYGLSGAFTVVPMSASALALRSAVADGDRLTLAYAESLDPDFVPDPGDYAVVAAGSARPVAKVEVGAAGVTLTLAGPVGAGAAVTVSYAPGRTPARSYFGAPAAALAAASAENVTRPELSIGEAVAAEGEPLEFVVTLSPASSQGVTVRYRTQSGTAAEGADFAFATDTLTFLPGQTARTVSVATLEDGRHEASESLWIVLSGPGNAWLAGRRAEIAGIGHVLDDDAVEPVRVPPTWEAVPEGVGEGGSFRLLFVTSRPADALSGAMAQYDRHVIESASAGASGIGLFAGYVRALASTGEADAREHSAAAATVDDRGIPVHWVGGRRVADDYGGLFDGNWDSNEPRDESGNPLGAGVAVFTGSAVDGTKDPSGAYLGSGQAAGIRVGRPGQPGGELDSGETRGPAPGLPLYGLTGVFTVDAGASLPAAVGATLALSPSRVLAGAASAEVEATVTLAAPLAAASEWSLSVVGGTAAMPEDFSATPRVLEIAIPAGQTAGKGTFSVVRQRDGEPECDETAVVQAVPERWPAVPAPTPKATLVLAGTAADSAACRPAGPLASVAAGPAGSGAQAAPEADPSFRAVPGTTARLAIWTDRGGYAPGEAVRLFRSVGPEGDERAYTFFYYLENIRTGRRQYLAAETGSKALADGVVDAFGMGEGAFAARRFPLAERKLAWEGVIPGAGSWQFVAEARSADASQIVKVAHAKFAVSARQPARVGGQDGPDGGPVERVWSSDRVYKLRGPVRVRAGSTLVIEAGTLVEASGPEAGILVERGGRIEVRGTRAEPVVMTCDAPVGLRAPGCWGGLVLLGGAPASRPVVAPARFGPLDYGGDDGRDSSGALRYLRVEFAGAGSPPGPAIALYGVGAGTAIEFVQSRQSLGHGIELRGGNARLRHVVSSGARGDSVAWAEGWHGELRRLFVRQGPEGGHGLAATGGGREARAPASPLLHGATLVGGGPRGSGQAARDALRLSAGASFMADSLVVTGFSGRAISAGELEASEFLAGRSGVRDAILHGNAGLYGIAQVTPSAAPYVDFVDIDPELRNVRYERNPDPRPRHGSAALGPRAAHGASLNSSSSGDSARTGAFGLRNWIEEWTVFGQEPDHVAEAESTAGRQGAR